MILSVLAVLAGGTVEPETRAEVPIPDGTDADVKIIAKIRDGHVDLDVHYEVAYAHPDVSGG